MAPWQHRVWVKSLAQVMTCWLVAPSHYLNQYWLIKSPWNTGGDFMFLYWLDFGWFSSWPWSWIFKVKYGICCISAKSGLIGTKQKANISSEHYASNMTIGFDLGHDLDFHLSQEKMVWLLRNEKQTNQYKLKASMTIEFDLGHDLERWGTMICWIVNGMTSDVGMPWTLLVISAVICHSPEGNFAGNA